MHVTVLMTVYNGLGTVRNAVESILNQTYSDWDFLIIDDCSTDGTWELLEAIAKHDSRVAIVRNPVRLGFAVCLNIGWVRARGDLIARMDADDFSFPQRLERQVEYMQSHPEVAVLGTGAELVDENDRLLGVAFRREQHEMIVRKIYHESPFFHPSVMVRRSFYEALCGYDERWKRCEDADLWFRGYRRFQFHNLQEALIKYKVKKNQTLREISERTFMLGLAAYRDRCLIRYGWYALLFLAVSLLTKARLYKPRTFRGRYKNRR